MTKTQTVFTLLLAIAVAGCAGMAGLDAQAVSDAVVEGLAPALAQIKGLSSEQVTAITEALRAAIAGNLEAPEGGFDWTPLFSSVGVTVAGLFGLNLHRNSTRAVALTSSPA